MLCSMLYAVAAAAKTAGVALRCRLSPCAAAQAALWELEDLAPVRLPYARWAERIDSLPEVVPPRLRRRMQRGNGVRMSMADAARLRVMQDDVERMEDEISAFVTARRDGGAQ